MRMNQNQSELFKTFCKSQGLTPLQMRVLVMANSPKYLVQIEYAGAIASELGCTRQNINEAIEHLVDKGFYIPNKQQRKEKLIEAIAQEVDTHLGINQSSLVELLCYKYNYSRSFIYEIIRNVLHLKPRAALAQELLDIFMRRPGEFTCQDLKEYFPTKHSASIHVALKRLGEFLDVREERRGDRRSRVLVYSLKSQYKQNAV